ncbi:alpha/beta hydrolase [Pseudonocardia sp. RS11V-5]|uniref:alpha/beta hydrolase n=1 Tax=Pseudonocardia terrae TaxID=2905831 RepID=UPI001E534681|nr:alpha/beta hydrolase [Pseudonocardia terrae]MCE3553247.1 alpha/beta hydrolase [Pseudonocardia terrae]
MPLDPQFRTVLDTLATAGFAGLTGGDAPTVRERYRTLALSRRGPGFVPEPVAGVEDTTADDVPVRVYTPAEDRGIAVVYLHGGGWVVGDLDTHDPLCRRVANALGAVVVSVDYRLAPEHPFPAGLDDAGTVLRWTLARHPDRPVGAAGDSAGASLAAGLALRARDAGLPLAGQLLFYPATDPAMTSQSVRDNGEGYFLTHADMAWFLAQYLPGGGTGVPEVDLLAADVAGVAPAVVATAEFDPLRDEGAAYAEHLAAAGVPVEHVPGPGLIHGYAAFLGVVDGADATTVRALGSFGRVLTG